jgi:hypothetical protein
MKQPKGKIKLIRDILGTEIYLDEAGIEWLALPNGDLIENK